MDMRACRECMQNLSIVHFMYWKNKIPDVIIDPTGLQQPRFILIKARP